MISRWFLSKTVRQACEFRKQAINLMRAQQDLLSPQAISDITSASDDLQNTIQTTSKKQVILEKINVLEQTAAKWLKPYSNPGWRETVENILVAVVIIMAIRTFFFQNMQIPTGSMQPTLYGITYTNYKADTNSVMPAGFQARVSSWFKGVSYYHYVAEEEGVFHLVDDQPKTLFPFFARQRFSVGTKLYSVWNPGESFFENAGVFEGHPFKKGEDIIKIKMVTGDHLFVDRFTFNFRQPQRGDIVIFETKGIEGIARQDTYYIKRLVALGGESVRIGNDQHLIINMQRLDANTPHFENVYSFAPVPKENSYFGHVNSATLRKFSIASGMKYFADEKEEYTVPTNHFMVMGDNTMNSADSRYWGAFPREKVIGRFCFVYWPISERFGWGQR